MLRSERFSSHFATLVALALFLVGPSVRFAWTQDLAKGEALIQRALAEGTKGRDEDSRRSRRDAEDTLQELAKLASKGLDKDPSCATCAEQLLRAHFMRAYFGYDKEYDECLKFGAQAMTRFPAHGRIAMHAGTALYNTGKYGDAIRAFKRYQGSSLRDPQTDEQVATMLRDSEGRYAPATLTVDADGAGLTITASEFRASAPPTCQWIAELETKTYTLYRVVAR